MPKNNEEVRIRIIMMLGIHSKMVFSLFVASELKKRIEKEHLIHQYGTKPAGAETMIPTFQQTRVQNPNYDFFSQMQ